MSILLIDYLKQNSTCADDWQRVFLFISIHMEAERSDFHFLRYVTLNISSARIAFLKISFPFLTDKIKFLSYHFYFNSTIFAKKPR